MVLERWTLIDADRPQPMLRPIEPGEAVPGRHAKQCTVVSIRPAVIGAGDGARAAACAVEQSRAAVPADVMERANLPVAITNGKHALGADVERQVIAGLFEGAHMTQDLPAGQEDSLELEPRHLRVVVDPGGHGMRGRGGRRLALPGRGG